MMYAVVKSYHETYELIEFETEQEAYEYAEDDFDEADGYELYDIACFHERVDISEGYIPIKEYVR